MAFVYHLVPNPMLGSVLVPLEDLGRVSPAAFEAQQAKYTRREAVLDARITADGLRFNATVHCAPLHPRHLYRLRAHMGLLPPTPAATEEPPGWRPGMFFEIPLERIRQHPAYWYRWETPWINGYPGEDVPSIPPLDEFEPFDHRRYRELSEVPHAHIDYLHRTTRAGKRPLMFVHIPHVLVAGPIDTSGLRIVRWEDPAGIG